MRRSGDERRSEIIQAALALFEQNGFDATSVEESTAKAKISKGLAYHYFKSKDEILVAIIRLRLAELNLADDEFQLYLKLYERLKPSLRRPDLVIYLQAQPDILIDRVRRRGVEAERRISESYLQRVAEHYANFFHHYDAAPLFIVNAESLNPVDKDEDFELLYSRLQAMRSYREFFGYSA